MPAGQCLCRDRRERGKKPDGPMPVRRTDTQMDQHTKESIMKAFEEYCDKNGTFIINTDKKHVDFIIDGLFHNEKTTGLKLCPCRISDGTRQKDLELLCPCNFFAQKTFIEKGRCWCGLFLKK